MLEQDVYSTDAFKQASKKWVLCKINGEKGEGPGLMKQYGISGFPTIKYLKADGTEFGGFVGYMPTDRVVSSMDSASGK
jgi:hypothetical protein